LYCIIKKHEWKYVISVASVKPFIIHLQHALIYILYHYSL
jgi:hypothetical protein